MSDLYSPNLLYLPTLREISKYIPAINASNAKKMTSIAVRLSYLLSPTAYSTRSLILLNMCTRTKDSDSKNSANSTSIS